MPSVAAVVIVGVVAVALPLGVPDIPKHSLRGGHIFGTAVEVLALEQDVWYLATLLHLSRPGWVAVSLPQPDLDGQHRSTTNKGVGWGYFGVGVLPHSPSLRQVGGVKKELGMNQAELDLSSTSDMLTTSNKRHYFVACTFQGRVPVELAGPPSSSTKG